MVEKYEQKYEHALNSENLNTSDFILLSTQILKQRGGRDFAEDIKSIRECYANYQYQDAIQRIVDLNNRLDNPVAVINQKARTVVSDPYGNESRRYFETVAVQKTWEQLTDDQLKSYNKMNAMMKENGGEEVAKMLPDKIQNIEDAMKMFDQVKEYSRSRPQLSKLEKALRKADDSLSKTKDRGEEPRTSETVYSRSPGIIKASTPIPQSDLLDEIAVDRVVDMFGIDPTIEEGYSRTHRDVPFVNSVSGHTYAITMLLKDFMEKYKDEKKEVVQNDVNNILKGRVTFTVLHGYHSLAEQVDVLRDPGVRELYNQYNINIDNIQIISDQELKDSFEQASNYCKTVNLQKALRSQLLTIRSATPSLPTFSKEPPSATQVPPDRRPSVKRKSVIFNEVKQAANKRRSVISTTEADKPPKPPKRGPGRS